MKVFKAIIGILIFLGIIAALIIGLLYKLESDRWKEFEESYNKVVKEGSVETGKVTWQGKILEFEEYPETKERIILVQAYKYRRPAEKFRFYAINIGSFPIGVKKGDWVELRGFPNGYQDGLPLLRCEMFDLWNYLFVDVGILK